MELAREIYALLIGSESRSRNNSMSDDTTTDSVKDRYEKMDLDVSIPPSMVTLVEFASNVGSSPVSSLLASSLPAWMTRGVTPFRIESRPLQPSAVVDSSDYECPLCIQLMVKLQHYLSKKNLILLFI
jgi:hypothetical protein